MVTTVRVGSGKVTHAATRHADGGLTVDCGAIRYRNTGGRRQTLTVFADGTPVTCVKCNPQAELIALPATPDAAPTARPTYPCGHFNYGLGDDCARCAIGE